MKEGHIRNTVTAGNLVRLAICALTLASAYGSLSVSLESGQGDVDLDVFLVPHSHCDPAWKSDYLSYYRWTVRAILEAVVDSLWRAPSRRFTWADISYLALWMAREGDKQSHLSKSSRPRRFATTGSSAGKVDNTTAAHRKRDSNREGDNNGKTLSWREVFQELVDSKQIELVHGGWVQHDEGLSTIADTIDMMELGQRYVRSLFGIQSRIAWQIDSFGHTGSTPILLRRLGFEAVFLTRVPQVAMHKLRRFSRLEGMWGRHGSVSDEPADEIFVHIPFDGTYAFPKGFDYRMGDYRGTEFVGHVADKASELVAHVRRVAAGFPSRKVMLMWGDDMRYSRYFRQLRLLFCLL